MKDPKGAEGYTLGELCRKVFPAEVKQEGAPEARRLRFVISTGGLDRDQDIIDPAGWDFTDYLRSPAPPVMWAHDYASPPIARTVSLVRQEDRIEAVAEFPPAGTYPFADLIYSLAAQRFLAGASVGFRPVEWTYDEARRGHNFSRQALIEWSVVPIGSNPSALIAAAVKAGEPLVSMVTWAREFVEKADKENGEALPLKHDNTANTTITAHTANVITTAIMTGFQPTETKVVPRNVSEERASEDTPWEAPTLEDFTDQAWDDLPDDEKRRIAGHFAWAREMPPSAFGSLKLPHHRPSDGRIVFRGVAAAMAALLGARGGVDVPRTERRAIFGHLAAHYRAFDREPPEFRDYESVMPEEAEQALRDAAVLLREAEIGTEPKEPERQPMEAVQVLAMLTSGHPVKLTTKRVGDLALTEVDILPVQKFNLAALPVEGSFEWIAERLTGKLRAYAEMQQLPVPAEGQPFVAATFATRAIFVLMGFGRPWSEDPSYEATYELIDGQPEWRGTPQTVDVRVHSEIVRLMVTAHGEDKTSLKSSRILAQRNLDRLKDACGKIQEVIAEEETRMTERGRHDDDHDDNHGDDDEHRQAEAFIPVEKSEIAVWLDESPRGMRFEILDPEPSPEPERLAMTPEEVREAFRAFSQEVAIRRQEALEQAVGRAMTAVTGRVY